MKRVATIALLLAGCASTPTGGQEQPDSSALGPALAASRPEPLVDLVLDAREVLGAEEDCPLVVPVDETRERWIGGCTLSDGTTVDGELVRYDGPEGAWLAAEGFALRQDGELLIYLDGALELFGEGDQMTLDAALSTCGVSMSCVQGVTTVDLSFSLFPLASWPTDYEATVTGVVAVGGAAPTAVDGTWSIDEAICPSEPVDGIFTLARGKRHALSLDGAADCDGCAPWNVQGLTVGEYCGVHL